MPNLTTYIDALVGGHGFVAQPPVSAERIALREAELDISLPDELSAFYRYTDGLAHSQQNYRFPSLASLSLDWFAGWPFLEDLGLLPLLDANDSNPLCVITRGPLVGIVAHIFHDGDTRLRFGSIRDMLHCLSSATSFHEGYLSSSVQTLPPEPDNATYHEAYSQLIEDFAPEDRESNSWRLRFAIDLCSDAEAERIADLISLGDEYVRSAAINRLRNIDHEDARRFLVEDEREFDAFVSMVSKMGPEDRIRRLNFPMLYASRHDPGFNEWLTRLVGRE